MAGLAGVSGSVDGAGSAAKFNFPQGVAADYFENIYVADTANSIIRKITPQGVVTTLAGKAGVQGSVDGLDSEASFGLPWTIAIDPAGNVYVTDASKPTIRKISKRLGHDNYWGLCFDWTFRWLVGRSSA